MSRHWLRLDWAICTLVSSCPGFPTWAAHLDFFFFKDHHRSRQWPVRASGGVENTKKKHIFSCFGWVDGRRQRRGESPGIISPPKSTVFISKIWPFFGMFFWILTKFFNINYKIIKLKFNYLTNFSLLVKIKFCNQLYN